MLWTEADDRRIERHFRELLAKGRTPAEAVRSLHHEEGIGALLLCGPLARVTGLSALEARQVVVAALGSPVGDRELDRHHNPR